MIPSSPPEIPPPPYEALRMRLLELAAALEAGQPRAAAELRGAVEAWWAEQRAWSATVRDLLTLHHEINNALVGVRGNAQLLMIGPAGREPGVKDRLEVVIRESERIQQAAARIGGLKRALANDDAPRAAA